MSDVDDDVEAELATARRELSPVKARHLLHGALKKARSSPASSRIALLTSAISAELAELESNAERRLEHRRKAIAAVADAKVNRSAEVVVAAANRRVDLSYDVFAANPLAQMRHELAESRREISTVLKSNITPRERAFLLAQQSSVLRSQARLANHQDRKSSLGESVRCARAAVDADATVSAGLVELGQSLWAAARWSDSDDSYFRDMNEAEATLGKATKRRDPLALLVTSRFFRQTYRPLNAVEHFERYVNIDTNRRRVLRESYIASEAAMQLWFSGYHDTATDRALLLARAIGREALEAGYDNARIIVDLALIEATRGDSSLAEATLRRLAVAPSSSWIEIVEGAIQHVETGRLDRILNAFVVGLGDSHAWNGLGTYAAAFASDSELAIRLYDVARRLDPQNPVVLTNLARKLITRGDAASLALADKYLVTAAKNADRSFVWWRSVRADLRLLRGEVTPLVRQQHLTSFKELQGEFAALMSNDVRGGERGYAFERLIARLLTLSFKEDVLGSHHVNQRQVDAAFRLGGVHYRVECKWHSEPLGESEIDDFARRLDTAETRGIFLSMSGYTDTAVKLARRVGEEHVLILFGPDDVNDIFSAKTRFEAVLERKLSWFQCFGEPYDVEVQKKARRRRTLDDAPPPSAG